MLIALEKVSKNQQIHPQKVDNNAWITYIHINSTRHASLQISVPGRVLYFIGYATKGLMDCKQERLPLGEAL
jgi:hypothetical protein